MLPETVQQILPNREELGLACAIQEHHHGPENCKKRSGRDLQINCLMKGAAFLTVHVQKCLMKDWPPGGFRLDVQMDKTSPCTYPSAAASFLDGSVVVKDDNTTWYQREDEGERAFQPLNMLVSRSVGNGKSCQFCWP